MTEILYLLAATHITIISVTLYLHRSQAHKSVQFHPIVDHFFRFYLWLTTGMITHEWVAVHRKHHQSPDKKGDPHSPNVFGIWKVFFGGTFLYIKAKKDPSILKLGVGTPNDWIERNVYSKYPLLGISLLLAANISVFGLIGILIWLIQMIWIPFWAAGVINGLAHWIGYRNHQVKDKSRNILPWGIIIGGEELHNNHHYNGSSAKLSTKPWEFDIGWMYIKILSTLGLAKIRQ